MRASSIIVVALAFIVGVAVGCSSDKGGEQVESTDGTRTLAQVNEWTVSEAQLQNALSQLPEQQREQYETRAGQAAFLDLMIQEELFHQEGLEAGLAEDPDVVAAAEAHLRGLIITTYYNKFVQPLASPSEEEMYTHYEQNKRRYTKMPIVRAQHIFSTNRDKLVAIKKRIEAGEAMTTLATELSEDEQTRYDGGDLGYFNPEGYIRSIGYSKEISEAAFSMSQGVVSEPIKWSKGYSLLRVTEVRPEELRSYDEVKEEIRRMFAARRIEEVKREVAQEIVGEYAVRNVLAEDLEATTLTDEESWLRAQESADPYQRLRLYGDIVQRFPDSKYAPDALFMIGFVYAEELRDIVEADRAFNDVITTYPDSKIARTAEWMLQNLNEPMPEFETLDELNKQIEQN